MSTHHTDTDTRPQSPRTGATAVAREAPERRTPPERPTHAHSWRTESSHHTSAGIVSYVRCPHCGARCVEARAGASAPTELSRAVGARVAPQP